ncbi:Zn-ribbon domain-containing OB-fold protein [Paraburkholderia sp. IW21]|uniref:Zn-ribbon domain-containing OB-fold protein n=1 Tax=Paraburkholderia sp. IW21 TaxID=3242488 RepID=UPI0035207A45
MPRKLPLLTAETAPFWQGGEGGLLNIYHCDACRHLFHPPAPLCPRCMSSHVGAKPVSGRGKVVSFTINHQAWLPDLPVPYVVAIVELAEREGLRFVTNIVGGEVNDVHIGMPVRVKFEQQEDVWLPLFEADPERSAA